MIVSFRDKFSFVGTFFFNLLLYHLFVELIKSMTNGQTILEIVTAVYITLCISIGYAEKRMFKEFLEKAVTEKAEDE